MHLFIICTKDINGSTSKPTVLKDIFPGTLVVLHQMLMTLIPFTRSRIWASSQSISALAQPKLPKVWNLSGGETKSRLAETLAPEGTYLIVKNPGALPVSVRLWVE